MRSARGKALGAALAAACAALGLAACAAAQPSASVAADRSTSATSTASSSATSSATSGPAETLRQRAEADAVALLKMFAVPAGGHQLSGPPNLPGGVLKTPLTYVGSTWQVHLTAFWEAPGSPQALLAWERAHLLPSGFTLGDSDPGTPGSPASDQDFELAPEGAIIGRELDVEVASAGNGQTGIRLDAWVSWQPPRPASSLIPSSATTVTLAEQTDGQIVGRPAQKLPVPVTITDPATVRKIAAIVDALPLSTLPPDIPCPATIGPYLSLTFRARAGGPALATVETGQQCVSVALTIGGVQQPALADQAGLNGRLVKAAGLTWKLPE